jgi:hypothetical protein
MDFFTKFVNDRINSRQYKMTFSETLWSLLFVFYIISVRISFEILCEKYPRIEHFVDTHPFLVILIGIVFLIVVPALFALFIFEIKDRKKSRCPKCKTKYKYGNMEIGPGKIITTFQCKKCGYENKITEPFVFKKI